jgi:hypothetical protein
VRETIERTSPAVAPRTNITCRGSMHEHHPATHEHHPRSSTHGKWLHPRKKCWVYQVLFARRAPPRSHRRALTSRANHHGVRHTENAPRDRVASGLWRFGGWISELPSNRGPGNRTAKTPMGFVSRCARRGRASHAARPLLRTTTGVRRRRVARALNDQANVTPWLHARTAPAVAPRTNSTRRGSTHEQHPPWPHGRTTLAVAPRTGSGSIRGKSVGYTKYFLRAAPPPTAARPTTQGLSR